MGVPFAFAAALRAGLRGRVPLRPVQLLRALDVLYQHSADYAARKVIQESARALRNFNVVADFSGPMKMLADLKVNLPKLAARALNDAAKHTRSEASSSIRQTFNIRKKDLDPRLRITPANERRLQAVVEARGEPIPLSLFGARRIRQGVSVAVLRGRRTVIRGSFLAAMASGHEGVFRREFKSRRQGKPYKQLPVRRVKTGAWAGTTYRPALPIDERKVISVPSMWRDHIDRQAREAGAYIDRRLKAQIDRFLAAGKPGWR